jgi:dihydropteroate synthase
MHMRGTPADMAARATYRDVAADVAAELEGALQRAAAAGVPREAIILDPGIGFAKTAEQSVELLARVGELRRLGRPLLVGPSRKSFIGKVAGAPVEARLPGTLAAVTACVLAGVELLRVHDVAPCRQAARIAAAIRDAAASSGPR